MRNEGGASFELIEELREIFEQATGVKPFIYKSIATEHEIIECPGMYSGRVYEAMRDDIMQLSLLMFQTDTGLGEKLKDVANAMRSRDLAIRGMLDGTNSEHKTDEYIFENTAYVIEKLYDVKTSEAIKDERYSKYREKMITWIEKLAKMDIWAFYLKQRNEMLHAEEEANFRITDETGEVIHGIPEKYEDYVKAISATEEVLLESLLRMPFKNIEARQCMSKIETMHTVVQDIIHGEADRIRLLGELSTAY